MPSITVQGYRITGSGTPNFTTAITAALAGASSVDGGGKRYGMRDILVEGDVVFGEFGKLQTGDLPQIGKTDGTEKPIQLSDDEGLLYKSWFLYHTVHRALLWIGTRHACGPGWLLELLKLRHACRLNISIMVPPEVFAKYTKNRTQVYSVEYGVAPSRAVETTSLVTQRMIRSASDFEADNVSMKIAVRRDSEDFLDRFSVGKLLRKVRNDPGTKKLKVKAVDLETGEPVMVDLIRERTKKTYDSGFDIQQLPRVSAYTMLRQARSEIWEGE